MTETNKLCCLVEHNPRPFSVSISPTRTINDLKELISREGVEALSKFPPADFVLTKVDVDIEASKSDIFAGKFKPNDNGMGIRSLDDPREAISEIWPTKPLNGHVHVFIGLPTTGFGKQSHAIDDLDSVQDSKRTKPVPPQIGETQSYKSLQQQPTEKILDDRPGPDPVPPVSLLYDGFGYFMDAVRVREGVSDVSTKRRDLELAVDSFADEMTDFYPNDGSRSFRGLNALNNILALGDDEKPYDAAPCLGWFKNEFVDIASSPVADLAAYATRSRGQLMEHFKRVDSSWRTPFLGLTVIGPYVTFYAIIFLQQWRIVSLTPTLSCVASACEGDDRKALYAAFTGALALLHRIDEDTARLISTPPTIQHADPILPYISALPKHRFPDEKVQFRILRSHPDNRLLYIAETLEKRQLVVKFTRSYSIELHAFCAEHGFAPGLVGFGKIPGGWSVVAMEYMSSVHPSQSPNLSRLCDKWIDELQELVQSFHDKDMVHGDLRESNILCEGENVMLIDFDWGGKVGEAAYPFVRLTSELRNGRDSTDLKITKDDDRRVLHNTLEQLKKEKGCSLHVISESHLYFPPSINLSSGSTSTRLAVTMELVDGRALKLMGQLTKTFSLTSSRSLCFILERVWAYGTPYSVFRVSGLSFASTSSPSLFLLALKDFAGQQYSPSLRVVFPRPPGYSLPSPKRPSLLTQVLSKLSFSPTLGLDLHLGLQSLEAISGSTLTACSLDVAPTHRHEQHLIKSSGSPIIETILLTG
ncbi:hypothetical protein H4582DRAFT_2141800 [Lactarius indigo]|nr:hypothetical protein H4582DRAFT_2141800 [Lactarius indigo]